MAWGVFAANFITENGQRLQKWLSSGYVEACTSWQISKLGSEVDRCWVTGHNSLLSVKMETSYSVLLPGDISDCLLDTRREGTLKGCLCRECVALSGSLRQSHHSLS